MAKRNFIGNPVSIATLREAAPSVGVQVVSAEDFPFMFSVRPFRGAICALLAGRGIRQGQRSVTFGGDGLAGGFREADDGVVAGWQRGYPPHVHPIKSHSPPRRARAV